MTEILDLLGEMATTAGKPNPKFKALSKSSWSPA